MIQEMTGIQFREWRRKLGLSQEAAARVLGISRATVVRWERGDWPIPPMAVMAVEHLSERLRQRGPKPASGPEL